MITLNRTADLGGLFRQLRRNAGLTIRQLAATAHVSRSGISKRETRSTMTVAGLIDHAAALGYTVVLVPREKP